MRAVKEDGGNDPGMLSGDFRDLSQDDFDWFQQTIANAFQDRPLLFKLALSRARDWVGRAIGSALDRLDVGNMRLEDAAMAIIASANKQTSSQLEENFVRREIIGSR